MSDAPTITRLRECLSYDPESGILKWKVNHAGVRTGDEAGGLMDKGYINVMVDQKVYKAHIAAFMIYFGRRPSGQIDHINGVRSDNRLCNLRESTQSQNQFNAKRRIDNTSGVKGVFWHKQSGKWTAQITTNGKRRTIGRFLDFESAVNARKNAAIIEHKEFARHE